MYIFPQDSGWAHRIRFTVDSCIISPKLWSPNSPGTNPFDYKIWDFMQEHVYKKPIRDLARLKQRLVEIRADFKQTIVDEQSILRATAWLIYGARRRDHISPLLQQLHLLQNAWVLNSVLLSNSVSMNWEPNVCQVTSRCSPTSTPDGDCTRPPAPLSRYLRCGMHGARAWNALALNVTSAPSLSSWWLLKTPFLSATPSLTFIVPWSGNVRH